MEAGELQAVLSEQSELQNEPLVLSVLEPGVHLALLTRHSTDDTCIDFNKESGENGEGKEALLILAALFVKLPFDKEKTHASYPPIFLVPAPVPLDILGAGITMKSDYVIIGGGLVGLSTAYQILVARPGSSVHVLEKEPGVALHQSTRNSGVIHTGVYYKPGSFKASLCTEGRRLLLDFAQAHGITHSICGKLIVATTTDELERLKTLLARGQTNGVDVRLISAEELKEREPYVRGVGALLVPQAGVIDFAGLAQALVKEISRLGGEIILNAKLLAATRTGDGWILEGSFPFIHAKYVVNCAGLHSDSVARKFGDRTEGRIVPFRGEYYILRDEARKLCNTMIYPVADPRFPFLGVHFTRRFDGSVECGPNAVLALAREGYTWRDINIRDLARMARFSGFRRLIAKHWRMGSGEMYRSISKAAFVKALQKLVPTVTSDDLIAGSAGVRAQVVKPDGSLEEDFSFKESPHVLHVLNAPSPAATSCLAIGKEVAQRVVEGAER